MTKRSPFPVPFGWFQVAWADELEVGQVVPIEYVGRNLVMWRDEAGAAARQRCVLPASGRALRSRRQRRRREPGLPLPRLALRRRGEELVHPLLAAHERQGVRHLVPDDRAQQPDHGVVPPRGRRADVGRPRGPRVQRPRELRPDDDHRLRHRGAVAGAGRERRRLGALPLRAPHRRGAGARVLRDGRPPHPHALRAEVPDPTRHRRRSYRRRLVRARVQRHPLQRDRRHRPHGLQRADQRLGVPHALQLHGPQAR